MVTPSQVNKLAVRAHSINFGIAITERTKLFVELVNLRRTDESEIEWPEKEDAPLSFRRLKIDRFEFVSLLQRNHCWHREFRELFTNTQNTGHTIFSFLATFDWPLYYRFRFRIILNLSEIFFNPQVYLPATPR